MSLFIPPTVRATDDNNNAISGAKWYFYLTGTTTLATVYTDDDLTTPAPNPVVANGGGLFAPTYLDPAVIYRAILKDASGAQIQDIDPISVDNLTTLAADTGAGLIGTSSGDTVQDVLDAQREILSADRTYYVRTDGSDSNDGLANTAAGAFLTIQKAVNAAYALDCNGHKVTINVADGTYTGAILIRGALLGASASTQPLQIIGDETTPANVIITSAADNTLDVSNGAYLLIAGAKIANTAARGILVSDGAIVEHRKLDLGACTSDIVLTLHHAVFRAVGSTTVSGSAATCFHATKRSIIDFSSQTLAFSGTPAFSSDLWGVNDASINLDSGTITGSATGATVVHCNGTLNVASLTGSYLGGTAPQVEDGGLIIGDGIESRILYVRPSDGDDDNDGMADTAARAFATITGALNSLAKREFNPIAWDSTNGIVIQLATSDYNETVVAQDAPYRWVMILGDETTPTNCNITSVTHGMISKAVRTKYYIRGCRLHATAGDCLRAEDGASITFRNVELTTASQAQLFAYRGGRLICDGNYAIVGGGAYHARAWMNGVIDIQGASVTISNTPDFSGKILEARGNGTIDAIATFTGTATGTKYYAEGGGVIWFDTATLPGDVAGSTGTGGVVL